MIGSVLYVHVAEFYSAYTGTHWKDCFAVCRDTLGCTWIPLKGIAWKRVDVMLLIFIASIFPRLLDPHS